MGQDEIINFLKECEKPVTRKTIAENLDCDPVLISHLLKRLIKFNEVKFIEYPREEASELVGYVLLRRTRFFFLNEEN